MKNINEEDSCGIVDDILTIIRWIIGEEEEEDFLIFLIFRVGIGFGEELFFEFYFYYIILYYIPAGLFLTNVNKVWFYLLVVSWRVNLGIYL